MGFEESIFGWLSGQVERLRRREAPELVARSAWTEPLLPRLRVLAAAGAGRPIDVHVVDAMGGIAGDAVLVPRRVMELGTREANERLLSVRVTLAGALVRAGLGRSEADTDTLARAAGPIASALAEELPGWAALRDALPGDLAPALLVGKGYPAASVDKGPVRRTVGAPPERGSSERTSARRRPPAKSKRLVEEPRADNPLTHSFEKVHTAEEHRGGNKRADGSDELSEHAAALDELELDEVVLSNERTHSIYRADAIFAGEPAGDDALADGLRYDEWDPRRRRYLARHCALTVEPIANDDAAGRALRRRISQDERRSLAQTRGELLRLDSALRWHTRQPDGPDIDVDALVDRASALRSGHEGPSRLYMSRRKRGRSLSLLLLLDASSSTDGWVDNRRVLDLERDATTLVSLALEGVVDELALAAFCSFSREDCRFLSLKSFHEPTDRGLGRLARLEPRGYTRIGPALRHATRALDATFAHKKAVLLLSDCKPTDTDRYEGRHGIGDVRQAVREAEQRRVMVFALSADPRSTPLLPQMFGARGHVGLGSPGDVARAMGEVVTQLMR